MTRHRDAHLRHAAHFKHTLLTADQVYEQGDESVDPALVQFGQDWPNLEGFAARPTIYQTAFFQERYEAQARLNVARSIQRLQEG